MNRLLMVTTIPTTLRAFLFPFAEHFRNRGWRVDAMAQGVDKEADCVNHFDHVWSIPWSRSPFSLGNLFLASQKVQEVLVRERYDIVHVHTPVASFLTRYAVHRLGVNSRPSTIYTTHGFHFHQEGDLLRNSAYLALEKIAGRWTDYLIVMNHDDERAARRHRIVPEKRLRYMPGIGVDLERYSKERVHDSAVRRLRAEMCMLPDEPLFSMVAEFNPGKRHRDAIRAFAQLENKKAHLAFAGTGSEQKAAKLLAHKLGVAERVHFLGFRSDICAIMRASVATLCPSEREGLPRSVLESMSLEVPVIGADIRGTRDLLGRGGGILVPVRNTKVLAGAMAWMLNHQEEAANIGRRGRSLVATYDLRFIIDLHDALYDEAIAESGRD